MARRETPARPPARRAGSRGPGRRSRRESERTRRRILDRAERLFAARGYRGVSLREIAAACGVRPFTVQHHFGSKLGLYQAVLSRFDDELVERITAVARESASFPEVVDRVVDDLFEFFVAHRGWVAVSARAALGEALPRGASLEGPRWIRFIDRIARERTATGLRFDPGLLLVTMEGILHHHVLSKAHYRELFGADVGDPAIRARTREHLKQVILALLAAPRG